MSWIKHLITEADNETADLKRVIGLWLAAQFSYLGFHAIIFNHQAFDPVAFGTGAMAIIGGIGAAIGLGRPGERPPT